MSGIERSSPHLPPPGHTDIIRRRQGLRQIRLAATEDPGKLLSPIGWAGGARSQVAAGKKVLGLYLL